MGGIIFTIGGPDESKSYEGSYADMRQDSAAAARKGISVKQYEDSASDRLADHAGERRMKEKEASEKTLDNGSPSYKPGESAFKNTPKVSCGFGHGDSQRCGRLRLSGHSGAHRIGKR